MSIVFKDEENKIYIITKGADSVIKKIIKNTKNNNNFNIDENLEFYGKKGLRTLLFAQREVTEEEYNNFKDAYNVCIIYLINIKYIFLFITRMR